MKWVIQKHVLILFSSMLVTACGSGLSVPTSSSDTSSTTTLTLKGTGQVPGSSSSSVSVVKSLTIGDVVIPLTKAVNSVCEEQQQNNSGRTGQASVGDVPAVGFAVVCYRLDTGAEIGTAVTGSDGTFTLSDLTYSSLGGTAETPFTVAIGCELSGNNLTFRGIGTISVDSTTGTPALSFGRINTDRHLAANALNITSLRGRTISDFGFSSADDFRREAESYRALFEGVGVNDIGESDMGGRFAQMKSMFQGAIGGGADLASCGYDDPGEYAGALLSGTAQQDGCFEEIAGIAGGVMGIETSVFTTGMEAALGSFSQMRDVVRTGLPDIDNYLDADGDFDDLMRTMMEYPPETFESQIHGNSGRPLEAIVRSRAGTIASGGTYNPAATAAFVSQYDSEDEWGQIHSGASGFVENFDDVARRVIIDGGLADQCVCRLSECAAHASAFVETFVSAGIPNDLALIGQYGAGIFHYFVQNGEESYDPNYVLGNFADLEECFRNAQTFTEQQDCYDQQQGELCANELCVDDEVYQTIVLIQSILGDTLEANLLGVQGVQAEFGGTLLEAAQLVLSAILGGEGDSCTSSSQCGDGRQCIVDEELGNNCRTLCPTQDYEVDCGNVEGANACLVFETNTEGETVNYCVAVEILEIGGEDPPPEEEFSVSFLAETAYTIGNYAEGIAVADLNGDAVLDIVAVNAFDDSVSVLMGNGNGTFADAQSYGFEANAGGAIALGDLDGDGNRDIVVTQANGALSTLLNNGDGVFQNPWGVAIGDMGSPVIGDFTGDAVNDVAIAGVDGFLIYPGDGDGTLGDSVVYGFDGDQFSNLVTGDWNSDNLTDIANMMGDELRIYQQTGEGTLEYAFSARFEGVSGASLAVGNFLLAGARSDDIAFAYYNSVGSAYVADFLYSDGLGDLTHDKTASNIGGSGQPRAIDLDADGLDALVVCCDSQNLSFTDLAEGATTSQAVSAVPRSIAVGDFDDDGLPDIAFTYQTGVDFESAVGVILQQAQLQ